MRCSSMIAAASACLGIMPGVARTPPCTLFHDLPDSVLLTAPHNVCATVNNAWTVLSVPTQGRVDCLFRFLDWLELIQDPRFWAHADRLWYIEEFGRSTLYSNVAFFAAAQVTAVSACDATGFDDPQLQARGVLIEMEDAELASPPTHAISPATGFLAAAAALERVYKDLLQHRLSGSVAERLLGFEAMYSLMSFDEVWQRNRELNTSVSRRP